MRMARTKRSILQDKNTIPKHIYVYSLLLLQKGKILFLSVNQTFVEMMKFQKNRSIVLEEKYGKELNKWSVREPASSLSGNSLEITLLTKTLFFFTQVGPKHHRFKSHSKAGRRIIKAGSEEYFSVSLSVLYSILAKWDMIFLWNWRKMSKSEVKKKNLTSLIVRSQYHRLVNLQMEH